MGKSAKSYLNRSVPRVFPKHSTLYADYENWLRVELKDWGEDLLFSEQSLGRGIFNPQFVSSLWTRHQSGLEVNMIGKVAPLMTFEMFMRNYLDQGEKLSRVSLFMPQNGGLIAPWIKKGDLQMANANLRLNLNLAEG